MKLYIATPINARPEQGFRNKYKAAQKRVRELKEIIKTDYRFYGYSFASSFDVNKSQNISEAIAMGNCIQAVIECDAIYLDHAWQSSKGCNLEYRAAKIYDKEIYEHDKHGRGEFNPDARETNMNNKPRKFRAKRIDGKGWATGWYGEHHIPEFDDHATKVIGYHITHSLFNDDPGEVIRTGHDGYWIDIDPDTLQPLEQQQTLFD